MKVKVVEITETDAKFKMLRQEAGSGFLTTISLLVIVLIKVAPPEGVGLTVLTVAALVGLLTALAIMSISAFTKNEIEALNIIFWGFKKFTLKAEAKNE